MEEQATDPRPADLGLAPADRIAWGYLVAAGLWILLSGPATAWIARVTSIPQTGLEIGKGLGFVLVTALALRVALRRWADRLRRAALREREAADRLREAEELRSTFLNGVSHELRTPLTSIIGYGDTIQKLCDVGRADEVGQLADRLVVNAHRLQALVLDLLDTDTLLRGMGQPRLKPTDVDELVRRVVEAVDLGARRIVVAGTPIQVDLDVAKFERVVALLLGNAAKHTPERATIGLQWGAENGHLVLTVEDDGPGLPPEILPRALDPFVQGRGAALEANPGMGIGLTLVDQYVRLHRGQVVAGNGPAGGAKVDVRIPLQATVV